MKPIKRKHGQAIIYIFFRSRRCGGNEHTSQMWLCLSFGAHHAGKLSQRHCRCGYNLQPLSYYIYNDTLGGMNLDMLKEFERNTGKSLKFWPVVNLHDALRKLEKGTYDMLASLPSDNSVKNRFITSRGVFLDRLVLIQASDSSGYVKIKSALDLASDTVYIQQDSPAALRLENLSNEIGAHIEVIKEKELSEEYLCMKVAKGEIGLAVVNENTART